jgi:hypothetical protein
MVELGEVSHPAPFLFSISLISSLFFFYSDMTDRIGSRARIKSDLLWTEPLGEKPSWKIWRDGADLSEVDEPPGRYICRSMRAFVARKPAPPPPPPPTSPVEPTGKGAMMAAAASLSVSVASLAAARVP